MHNGTLCVPQFGTLGARYCPVDPHAVSLQVAQQRSFARRRHFPPPPQRASWPFPAANLGRFLIGDVS